MSLPSRPGHDPDRWPRRARLPGPGVLAGLTAEVPAAPGPPEVEPERAAARALRDKGGRQVGGQVRSGRPLGPRTRRRRPHPSRVPPGRVGRLRISRLRRQGQQLDDGLIRGRAAAGLAVGRGRDRGDRIGRDRIGGDRIGATGSGATGSGRPDRGDRIGGDRIGRGKSERSGRDGVRPGPGGPGPGPRAAPADGAQRDTGRNPRLRPHRPSAQAAGRATGTRPGPRCRPRRRRRSPRW